MRDARISLCEQLACAQHKVAYLRSRIVGLWAALREAPVVHVTSWAFMAGKPGIIYLAVPYTHEDPVVRRTRFIAVTRKAAWLVSQGCVVFSPITLGHCLSLHSEEPLPTDAAFWASHNRAMMECCTHLYIYKLPGWEESVGVELERRWAKELGLTIVELEE